MMPLMALWSGVAGADIPPGGMVDEALVLDVTPDGFGGLEGLAYGLVPPRIDIPDVIDTGGCPLFDFKSAWVGLAADTVDISTSSGQIDISADLTVWINDPNDKFELVVYTICFIEDTCNGYLEPFPVHLDTYIALTVDPYTGQILADAGEITVTYDLQGVDLQDCWIDWAGDLLLPLLDSQLESLIADAIGDLSTELETLLNDTFSQLAIDEQLELGEQLATIHFAPSNVLIEQAGFRMAFEGSFDVPEAAACVEAFDPGGSLETPGGLSPPGVQGEHLAANLADDFVNQALYAVWRSGLLCVDLGGDSSPIDIGLPLDTSLLPLLFGDMYTPLFPEPQPLVLSVVPEKPPVLDLSRPAGAGIAVDDFALSVFAEIDGRQARLLDVALDVNAGADIGFDPATGLLSADLDLSGDGGGPPPVVAAVRLNEFAPGTDADIAGGLSGLLENPLIGSLITMALGDTLGFYLPSFCAFGVTNADLLPTGPQGGWLGVYLWSGPVEYVGTGGCAGDGGGCGGGCGGTTTGSGTTGGCNTDDLLGCGGTTTDTAGGGGCDTETCDVEGCTDLGTEPIEISLCGCSASGSLQSRLMVVAFALLVVARRRLR